MGAVSYRLALPPSLSGVYEVFHVSILRKYTLDPAHIVDWSDFGIDANGTVKEGPVHIMDSKEKIFLRKIIRLVKVLWQHIMKTLCVPGILSSLRTEVRGLFIWYLNDCCICM